MNQKQEVIVVIKIAVSVYLSLIYKVFFALDTF